MVEVARGVPAHESEELHWTQFTLSSPFLTLHFCSLSHFCGGSFTSHFFWGKGQLHKSEGTREIRRPDQNDGSTRVYGLKKSIPWRKVSVWVLGETVECVKHHDRGGVRGCVYGQRREIEGCRGDSRRNQREEKDTRGVITEDLPSERFPTIHHKEPKPVTGKG